MPIFGVTASSNMSTKLTDFYQIATTTVGATSVADITFSSIPATYTDLILISSIKSNNANTSSLLFEINGVNSGSLYSGTMIYGSGSAKGSNRTISLDYGLILRNGGLSANTAITQPFITHFMNYSNTTNFKTVISRNNVDNVVAGIDLCLWRSTAAITSIRIFAQTNDFAIGSTFTL